MDYDQLALPTRHGDVACGARTGPRAASPSAGEGAARRDADAFLALYRAQVTPVYRYLLHHVGQPAEAEDLTAAVFAKALASFDRYAGRGPLVAWLFGIARHALADYRRHRRPTLDIGPLAAVLVDADALPEERAIAAERAGTLQRMIATLPPDQREALVLHYLADLPAVEVARVQGCTAGAARMRIHRALTGLRRQYQQEGIE